MTPSEIPDFAGLPRGADGPVFAEPWQAQAFALTLQLHEAGCFSWPDWASALSNALAADPLDNGARYYEHWVEALEHVVTVRAVVTPGDLAQRKEDWTQAYQRTPHGRPVDL